mmetsp:Transcript_19952/g.69253  ORF Transcript_19952/g.69253 Transcript_19952/m.69253 type:complete len:281 (+) Transcript_19952:39-881(+)
MQIRRAAGGDVSGIHPARVQEESHQLQKTEEIQPAVVGAVQPVELVVEHRFLVALDLDADHVQQPPHGLPRQAVQFLAVSAGVSDGLLLVDVDHAELLHLLLRELEADHQAGHPLLFGIVVLRLQDPRQLHEDPEGDALRPFSLLGASLPSLEMSCVDLLCKSLLLVAGLWLPREHLEHAHELHGVDVAAPILVEVAEELFEALNLGVGEAGLLLLPGDDLRPAAVHEPDEGVEVVLGAVLRKLRRKLVSHSLQRTAQRVAGDDARLGARKLHEREHDRG